SIPPPSTPSSPLSLHDALPIFLVLDELGGQHRRHQPHRRRLLHRRIGTDELGERVGPLAKLVGQLLGDLVDEAHSPGWRSSMVATRSVSPWAAASARRAVRSSHSGGSARSTVTMVSPSGPSTWAVVSLIMSSPSVSGRCGRIRSSGRRARRTGSPRGPRPSRCSGGSAG